MSKTQKEEPCDWDPRQHYYFGKGGYRCRACTVWQPDADVVKALGSPDSVPGCPAYVPKTPSPQTYPVPLAHDWDIALPFACKACGVEFVKAQSVYCPGPKNLATPPTNPVPSLPAAPAWAAHGFSNHYGFDSESVWASETPTPSDRDLCPGCDRELCDYLDRTYDADLEGYCAKCQPQRRRDLAANRKLWDET